MNRNTYKLLKIVVFLVCLILADQIVGFILRKLYFHEKTGQHYALNYVLRKCSADVLIFGSSRAVHHYDSRIISNKLQMSCYNAGVDGGHSIILPYAQIKVITKRYLPKVIIIELDPNQLVHYLQDYDRLSILLPYYAEFPELRSVIEIRGPFEKVKLLSAIYPFNSGIINSIRLFLNIKTENIKDYNGYFPILNREMNASMGKGESEYSTNAIIDSNMVDALKSIICICKEKNITLIVVNSPIYHDTNYVKRTLTPAGRLALDILNQNKIKYYDFTYDTTFSGHMEWFADINHLNEHGAKIFTNLVADKIINDNTSAFLRKEN
jgi:hypothetical protein